MTRRNQGRGTGSSQRTSGGGGGGQRSSGGGGGQRTPNRPPKLPSNTGGADWITQWANNNRGNQAVAGAANDLFYNAASADLQTRSDVNYATQMMPKALEYQRGSQLIATQADLSRMSAEGVIARDLTAQQGAINTGITRLQTDALRYGADRGVDSTRLQTDAQRYGADQELAGTRYSSDRHVDATRLQTDAQRYGYDREFEGRKYVSDNELTGVREGYQSQERQIGLRGSEDRKTLTQGTDETLRLRSDARGAIASTCKRFFG